MSTPKFKNEEQSKFFINYTSKTKQNISHKYFFLMKRTFEILLNETPHHPQNKISLRNVVELHIAVSNPYSVFNKLTEAEFKEIEPRLKFETRLKYGWFHLKLYSIFQVLSGRPIETSFLADLRRDSNSLNSHYKNSRIFNFESDLNRR